MRCISHVAVVLLSLSVQMSCENKNQVKEDKSESNKGEFQANGSIDQEPQGPETISPPSNIMGSYLLCREAPVSFDDEKAESIGCNIYEKQSGARVDVVSIGKNIEWAYDSSRMPPSIKVSIFKATPEQKLPYLVYFSFLSPSEKLPDILRHLRIDMEVSSNNSKKTLYTNESFMVKPSGAAAPADELPPVLLPDAVGLP